MDIFNIEFLTNIGIQFLLNFKDWIILIIFVLILLHKKINIKKILLLSLILTITNLTLSNIPSLSEKIYIVTPLSIIICIIFFCLTFNSSIINTSLCWLIVYSFILLIQFILFSILNNFNIYSSQVATNLSNYFIINLISNLILILIMFFISKTKLRICIDNNNIKINNIITILIGFILTTLMLFVNAYFAIETLNSSYIELLVFNLIFGILLFIIMTYNTIKNNNLILKEQELEYQKLYIKTLTDLVDGLRIFKHDYANVLNCINGYISLGDTEGLKKYFKDVLKDYIDINNLSVLSEFTNENPAIYGLITAKLYSAQSHKININIHTTSDLKYSCVNSYELCKILGILLDNAIEETSKLDDKKINITISENPKDNNYYIKIQNNTKEDIDIQKIFEKGISTKGNSRGLGLWEVRNILNKYENASLITTYKNNMFNQDLYIEKQI